MRKKVLVLGGNFGGLTAALSVKQALDGDVDVTVVSASDRFLFNPSLIWIPFGKRSATDIIAIDRALTRLSDLDPQHARIVELRYFGGLSVEETAEALSISPATVKRHWTLAKAWLLRELETGSSA